LYVKNNAEKRREGKFGCAELRMNGTSVTGLGGGECAMRENRPTWRRWRIVISVGPVKIVITPDRK
jgi:hypothetical protein